MVTQNILAQHFSTPGHGFVCVPIKTLCDLGVLDLVTPYSYVGTGEHLCNMKGYAYLEEDCDANMIYSALDFSNVTYDEYCGFDLEQQMFEVYGSEQEWRNNLRRINRYSLMQQGFFNKTIDPALLEHLKAECRHLRNEEDY